MFYQVDRDLGSIIIEIIASVIKGTKSKRKVVTLSDGWALIVVNLWDGLAETVVHKGTCIEVPCAHVDLYQNKRSLNSTGGIQIQEKSETGTILFLSYNCLNSFISFANYKLTLFHALK